MKLPILLTLLLLGTTSNAQTRIPFTSYQHLKLHGTSPNSQQVRCRELRTPLPSQRVRFIWTRQGPTPLCYYTQSPTGGWFNCETYVSYVQTFPPCDSYP